LKGDRFLKKIGELLKVLFILCLFKEPDPEVVFNEALVVAEVQTHLISIMLLRMLDISEAIVNLGLSTLYEGPLNLSLEIVRL